MAINDIFILQLILVILTFHPFIANFLLMKPKYLLYSLFGIINLGVILRNIFQPRIYLDSGQVDYIGAANFSGNETWVRVSQATTLLFLILCMLIVIYGLFFTRVIFKKDKYFIFLAGLFLYLPLVISALVSSNKDFYYGLFLFPILVISLFLAPELNYRNLFDVVQYCLLLYIYGSLLALIFYPDWAVIDYAKSIIGIDFRLAGVTIHPNTLGFISAFSIIVAINSKRKRVNLLHMIASSITLILSQSKTAWIAICLLVLYLVILKLSKHKKAISRIFIILLTVGSLFLIFMVLQSTILKAILPSDIATFTDRLLPWQITIEVWRKNPLLGYGTNLWDLNFRQQFGEFLLWVGHAHNQWIHTLGSSGIFGIFTLLVYVYFFIKKSINEISYLNYLPFTCFILMVSRMVTETTFRNLFIDEAFIIHGLMFLILLNSSEPMPVRQLKKV